MEKSTINSERFESKFIIDGIDGCWLWVGSKNLDGYGNFFVNKKCKSAHRVAFTLYVQEIPKGLSVLHKCDVRNCVNPKHLFLGTQKENMVDCSIKGRIANNGHFLRGEKQWSAKYTKQQVLKVREMYATGNYTYKEISNILKIKADYIGLLVRRVRWKHV